MRKTNILRPENPELDKKGQRILEEIPDRKLRLTEFKGNKDVYRELRVMENKNPKKIDQNEHKARELFKLPS